MTDFQKIMLTAGLSAIVTGGGTFMAMQRQVDRLEVRQEEQYRALMNRSDEIRLDLRGIRSEIMGILKERR